MAEPEIGGDARAFPGAWRTLPRAAVGSWAPPQEPDSQGVQRGRSTHVQCFKHASGASGAVPRLVSCLSLHFSGHISAS